MRRYRKFNADYFYIGILNLDSETTSYNELKELLVNGAIIVEKNANINGKKYTRLMSVFLKPGVYNCLHNSKYYKTYGNPNFCEQMVPLKDALPKIGYSYPKELSVPKALQLFNIMFGKGIFYRQERLYDDALYKLDDLSLGGLMLYTGSTKCKAGETCWDICNLPQFLMLQKSDAKYMGEYGKSSVILDPLSESNQFYRYVNFECLYLDKEDGTKYNINDFQTYDKGILTPEDGQNMVVGESYYGLTKPFLEVLDEQQIKISKDELTIPDALKLCRKMNKKRK